MTDRRWHRFVCCISMLAFGMACSPALQGSLPERPTLIEAFLEAQDLPRAQQHVVISISTDPLVEWFLVEYGDPMDCPAGCIFDTAFGLRYEDTVGWVGMSVRGDDVNEAAYFDFTPEHPYLFSDDFLSALHEAEPRIGHHHLLWLALARDEDTPRPTLLRIAHRLREASMFRGQAVALALMGHPAAASDREILTALLDFYPRNNGVAQVRQRARDLLARTRPGE